MVKSILVLVLKKTEYTNATFLALLTRQDNRLDPHLTYSIHRGRLAFRALTGLIYNSLRYLLPWAMNRVPLSELRSNVYAVSF